VTSSLWHASLLHLLFNVSSLWNLRAIEHTVRSARDP